MELNININIVNWKQFISGDFNAIFSEKEFTIAIEAIAYFIYIENNVNKIIYNFVTISQRNFRMGKSVPVGIKNLTPIDFIEGKPVYFIQIEPIHVFFHEEIPIEEKEESFESQRIRMANERNLFHDHDFWDDSRCGDH